MHHQRVNMTGLVLGAPPRIEHTSQHIVNNTKLYNIHCLFQGSEKPGF